MHEIPTVSRSLTKIAVNPQVRRVLRQTLARGSARERRQAQIILGLSRGNRSWRGLASRLKISTSTVAKAVGRFRRGGAAALLKRRRPTGRHSPMKDPRVKLTSKNVGEPRTG